MNLPNTITMSRILCVPLLIWLLSPYFPFRASGAQEITASIVFVLASITDGIDGYLARKNGQITTIGMLLDPLADKLMIATAFVCLVEFNPHIMKAWIVVLVIGREFLVTGLRTIASSEGFTIQARGLGKLKMVAQIVSVVAVVLDRRWSAWHIGWLTIPVEWIALGAVYFMVAVAVISAVDYFTAFWGQVDRAAASRRAAFALGEHEKNGPAPGELH